MQKEHFRLNNDFKILFLDIETSPNIGTFWRPGYNLNISHDNILEERQVILASYSWNKDKPITLKWKKDKNNNNKYLKYTDESLIKKLAQEINKADLIVHQNGDRFDLPWLRGRAMLHDIHIHHTVQTFDTLKVSRKLLNINSFKLDYLGKFFLNDQKASTGGFQLWLDCINGKTKALNHMQTYCEQDVILLRKYYNYLMKFAPSKHNIAAFLDKPIYACPVCASTDIKLEKKYFTKAGTPKYRVTCHKEHEFVLTQAKYSTLLNKRS